MILGPTYQYDHSIWVLGPLGRVIKGDAKSEKLMLTGFKGPHPVLQGFLARFGVEGLGIYVRLGVAVLVFLRLEVWAPNMGP